MTEHCLSHDLHLTPSLTFQATHLRQYNGQNVYHLNGKHHITPHKTNRVKTHNQTPTRKHNRRMHNTEYDCSTPVGHTPIGMHHIKQPPNTSTKSLSPATAQEIARQEPNGYIHKLHREYETCRTHFRYHHRLHISQVLVRSTTSQHTSTFTSPSLFKHPQQQLPIAMSTHTPFLAS